MVRVKFFLLGVFTYRKAAKAWHNRFIGLGNRQMVIQFLIVWHKRYPVYTERMAAMSHPNNLHNAFECANMLFLEPKE